MYQETDSGEYIEIETMSTSGYTINEENSYCTLDNVNKDNNALLYTNDNNEHVIANLQKGSKCYLYFDKYSYLIGSIENSYPNNQSLAYDDYGNLRYIGTDPDNYVSFNGELWRIIGIMNNTEKYDGSTEALVKIIRNESIGAYAWDYDPNMTSYNNDQSTSQLQELLNSGAYYNKTTGRYYTMNGTMEITVDFSNTGLTEEAKVMIETVTWQLGGAEYYDDADNGRTWHWYNYEHGIPEYTVYSDHATEWTGEVGLIYVSDYGYATSGGSTTDRETCLATELWNWNG